MLDEAVCLAGHPVEVAFQTAGVTPDAADIARYWEVEFYWPQIWQSVLSKLGNELEDDGADGERSDFLAKARPRYLEFFGTAAECEWELVLEPEIYGGHIVTMRMAHHQCYDFRLDG
ncbi:MAG TPA: hypothetical protein VFE47_25800 [Tepidisphaeraceae bacterium]|nr:hypothetical protein [Tepidisphaeraceae bacterium]